MPWKTKSVLSSFRCAISGICLVWSSDRNAKIEVCIGAGVVAYGLCLSLPRTDWAVLLLTIGAVLGAEAANSAMEAAVDLASPEYHELAKRAKDMAAGAVLLLALTAIAIGLLILGPPTLALIRAATPAAD